MAATIKDISRETGLSLATISKYLNGGNVLPRNREKIDAAVEKLHYQVNEIARGLVTNRTRTIGVIVYNIASTFNGTLLSHIGHQLRRENYGMLICDSAQDLETEAQNVRFLMSKKVDGIIVIPVCTDPSSMAPAVEAGIPVVAIDRKLEGDFDSVLLNNRESSEKLITRLIKEGHRRIAIIGSSEEYTGVERERGYLAALEKAGISVPPEYIRLGVHTVEFGYAGMKELMALKERPTAVFSTNYDLNIGMVMALNELGIKSPEEVSLVGFDDFILPHVINPNLTVMKQPMREMGHAAVDMVLGRINGSIEGPAQVRVFDAKLIEGNSDQPLWQDGIPEKQNESV